MARSDVQKIELFTYLMALGADLGKHPEFDGYFEFVNCCIDLNRMRKEYHKQCQNVMNRCGAVNGKWYEKTTKPFKDKIDRVKQSMVARLKRYSTWFRIVFDGDGEVFLLFDKKEIDISKF